MTDITVATPDDLDAVVVSVAALFQEDAGTRDPLVDTDWPTREGVDSYATLIADPTSLVLVARDGDETVGHLVGRLRGPSATRPVIVAVLQSIHVIEAARRAGVGGRLVDHEVSSTTHRPTSN